MWTCAPLRKALVMAECPISLSGCRSLPAADSTACADGCLQKAVDDAVFWKKWNGPETLYVLTDRPTYAKLREESVRGIYLIAQSDYDVVFSNKMAQRTAFEEIPKDL